MATTRVILLLLIASISFSESCQGQSDGMVVEVNLKISVGGCQKNSEECTTTTPTITTPRTTTKTTKTRKTTTTPTTTASPNTTSPECLASMISQRNKTVNNPVLFGFIEKRYPTLMLVHCRDASGIDYSVEINDNLVHKSPLVLFCDYGAVWLYYSKNGTIPVPTFDCSKATPNIFT